MSPRNILIILLVLCVIAVAYILITSYSGETEKVYSVKEVLSQSDNFKKTGEKISVKGYYTYYTENIAQITDSVGNPGSIQSDFLFVDHSDVENPNLKEGSKYLFTGVLQEDPLNPNSVILIASEIETN